MTRDGRESYGPGGRDAGRLGDRRDVLGRRAESVEESTRTSSQSVSEAKEGSEEGSLSDTTTANEDKLGGCILILTIYTVIIVITKNVQTQCSN